MKPTAAEAIWPYPHRTMDKVMAEEARRERGGVIPTIHRAGAPLSTGQLYRGSLLSANWIADFSEMSA